MGLWVRRPFFSIYPFTHLPIYKYIYSVIILSCFLTYFLFAQVQKLEPERIPTNSELSQSTVTFILQDDQGFMWFVSDEGLSRFDGYHFKLYQHDPANPNSLSGGGIREIYEDNLGILWVITAGDGLDKLNRVKDQFKHYQHDPKNSYSLSSNEINWVFEDHLGTLWFVSSNNAVNRYDRENDRFIRYQSDSADSASLSGNDVNIILEDRAGTLWFATESNGLNRFIREKDHFIRYQHDPADPNSLSSNEINHIIEDDAGRLWIATGEGVSIFDRERKQFLHIRHDPANPNSLSDNRVTCIFQDSFRTFWIGTEAGGLNKLILPLLSGSAGSDEAAFDPEKLQFTFFRNNPQRALTFQTNHIFPVFEDKFGTLWAGTSWRNLHMFDQAAGGFSLVNPELPGAYHRGNIERFANQPDRLVQNWLRTTLDLNEITAVYEDRSGVLWVGTTGSGINKYNPEKKTFSGAFIDIPKSQAIFQDRDGILWIGSPEGLYKYEKEPAQLTYFDPEIYYNFRSPGIFQTKDKNITAIYEDRAGRLWIGTEWTIYVLEKSVGRIALIKKLLLTQHIKFIYEDRSGEIWIGTTKGLNEYDPQSGILLHHQSDTKDPNTLSNSDINVVFEDLSGKIWIGTASGLTRYDRANGTFTRYLTGQGFFGGIRNNNIVAITEIFPAAPSGDPAGEGSLWLATLEGLLKFDPETETITTFTEENGLCNNAVVSMMRDGRGNLWLGTLNGLSRFSPQSGIFKNYHHADGLPDYVFNFGASFQNRNGGMYFGSVNGVTMFHPDSIRDDPHKPSIVLTSFKILNREVALDTAIAYKKRLDFSQQDKVFTIGFATLHFADIRKNQFAYKLEGFDEDWIYSGNRREATYTNLDLGEYVLRVKGSDNAGVWNERGAAIKIIVTPPWWKTGWAYTLYLLLAAGLLYGSWRFQLNRERMRQQRKLEQVESEKLREVDRLKSRFFANISHEFRTPLTLMIGPVEQMLSGEFKGNIKEQYRLILRNGQRLLRLINQLLDISRLEAGRMTLQACEGDIIDFLKKVVSAFESLAARKEIDLRLQAPAEPLMVFFDRDKLEKIVTNLLGNAFKFTGEGDSVIVDVSIADLKEQNKSEIPNPKSEISEFVRIRVKDSGIGIPADRLPHIFDRFYQTDDSYTRDQEGSGIGLALTKELVELHRGQISVESAPGEGTTFTVRLPLGKGHLAAEEIVEEISDLGLRIADSSIADGSTSLTTGLGLRIADLKDQDKSEIRDPKSEIVLIVEDNPDMRAYLRESLKDSYKILEAEDGEQGLKKGVSKMPDLIISDVMMPKMDGYELCRKLKSDERTSHIPVILLTARADAESKIEGLETGADDYLAKPFDARELRVRVKNLIELRRKLWEKFRQGSTVEPRELALTSIDAQFLERAMAVVEAHIAEPDFETEAFGKEIGLSRTQLYRKLRALTGQSTHEFIRTLRLKRAAQLLQHRTGNVSEIAYQVGFNNLSHFARVFREMFGLTPSAYAARYSEEER